MSSSPTPCNEQGHLQLDQVAQSPMQLDVEGFQGWGIYHLSGQHVPVFHHPHCKKFLPYIQSKPTLPWFKTIAHCRVTMGLAKIVSTFPIGPLRGLEGCNKVPPQPSLLQAEHPQLSQPFLIGEVLQPSGQFMASSGPSLTGPCLSWAEGCRAGCRTPGEVSSEWSRGAESLPSTCWPRCFECSQGYNWQLIHVIFPKDSEAEQWKAV